VVPNQHLTVYYLNDVATLTIEGNDFDANKLRIIIVDSNSCEGAEEGSDDFHSFMFNQLKLPRSIYMIPRISSDRTKATFVFPKQCNVVTNENDCSLLNWCLWTAVSNEAASCTYNSNYNSGYTEDTQGVHSLRNGKEQQYRICVDTDFPSSFTKGSVLLSFKGSEIDKTQNVTVPSGNKLSKIGITGSSLSTNIRIRIVDLSKTCPNFDDVLMSSPFDPSAIAQTMSVGTTDLIHLVPSKKNGGNLLEFDLKEPPSVCSGLPKKICDVTYDNLPCTYDDDLGICMDKPIEYFCKIDGDAGFNKCKDITTQDTCNRYKGCTYDTMSMCRFDLNSNKCVQLKNCKNIDLQQEACEYDGPLAESQCGSGVEDECNKSPGCRWTTQSNGGFSQQCNSDVRLKRPCREHISQDECRADSTCFYDMSQSKCFPTPVLKAYNTSLLTAGGYKLCLYNNETRKLLDFTLNLTVTDDVNIDKGQCFQQAVNKFDKNIFVKGTGLNDNVRMRILDEKADCKTAIKKSNDAPNLDELIPIVNHDGALFKFVEDGFTTCKSKLGRTECSTTANCFFNEVKGVCMDKCNSYTTKSLCVANLDCDYSESYKLCLSKCSNMENKANCGQLTLPSSGGSCIFSDSEDWCSAKAGMHPTQNLKEEKRYKICFGILNKKENLVDFSKIKHDASLIIGATSCSDTSSSTSNLVNKKGWPKNGIVPGHMFTAYSLLANKTSRENNNADIFYLSGNGLSLNSRVRIIKGDNINCTKNIIGLTDSSTDLRATPAKNGWKIQLTRVQHANILQTVGTYTLCVALNGVNFASGGSASMVVPPILNGRGTTMVGTVAKPNGFDEAVSDLSAAYNVIGNEKNIWSTCPVRCGDCISCTHDDRFVDEQGYKCEDWLGLDCKLAQSLYGYSTLGMLKLQTKCQCACLNHTKLSYRSAIGHFPDSKNEILLKCSACRPGFFSSNNLLVDVNALDHNALRNGHTCETCPFGKFSSGEAHVCVNACPVGKYAIGQGCYDCRAGTFNNVSGGLKCINCQAGLFTSSGSSVCSKCAKGRYSAGSASACVNCPLGTYLNAEGSTSYHDCLSCQPGFYSNDVNGAGICTKCEAGKFSLGYNETTCTACGPGFYSNIEAQSKCNACPTGKSTKMQGAMSIDKCEPICNWQALMPNTLKSRYIGGQCTSKLDVFECEKDIRCVYDQSKSYQDALDHECSLPSQADCSTLLTQTDCDKAYANYESCKWENNKCNEESLTKTCQRKSLSSSTSECLYSSLYSKCRAKTKCRENKCSAFPTFSSCDAQPGCGWLPIKEELDPNTHILSRNMESKYMTRSCQELSGYYETNVQDVRDLRTWCDSRYKIYQCRYATDADTCESIGNNAIKSPCQWVGGNCLSNTVLPREGVFKLDADCEVDTAYAYNISGWQWKSSPHENVNGAYENIIIDKVLAIIGSPDENGGLLPKIKPKEGTDIMCRDESTVDCGSLFPIYPGGTLILQKITIEGFRYRRGYQPNYEKFSKVHRHEFVTLISLQTTAGHYTFYDHNVYYDPSFATQNSKFCYQDTSTINGPKQKRNPLPLTLEICGSTFKNNQQLNIYHPSSTASKPCSTTSAVGQSLCHPTANVWFADNEPSVSSGVGPGVISVGSSWKQGETAMGTWRNPNTAVQDGPDNYATVLIEDTTFEDNKGASAGVLGIQQVSSVTNPTVVIRSSSFFNNEATYTGSAISIRNNLPSDKSLPGYITLYNNTFSANKIDQKGSCQGQMTHSDIPTNPSIDRTLRTNDALRDNVNCIDNSQCQALVTDIQEDDDEETRFPFLHMNGAYEMKTITTANSGDVTKYHSYYLKSPSNRAQACPTRYPVSSKSNQPDDTLCTVDLSGASWDSFAICKDADVYQTPVQNADYKMGSLMYDNLGGTIFISSNAKVYVTDCQFMDNEAGVRPNNRAGSYGGAILVAPDIVNKEDQTSGDAVLTLIGNTFSKNKAFIGGALYVGVAKAKINVDSTNTFISNEAAAAGGLLFSTSAINWGECQGGYYSLMNQQAVDHINDQPIYGCFNQCPAGRYGNGQDSDCTGVCPEGHYCVAGTATKFQSKCPLGRYASTGKGLSVECEGACPQHATTLRNKSASSIADCVCDSEYFYLDGICKKCAKGYTFDENLPQKCRTCDKGKFKAVEGWGQCVPCPTGTYAPVRGTTSNTGCLSCPTNSNTNESTVGTSISDCICNNGYFKSSTGGCIQCAKGSYYNASSSSTDKCVVCPAGKYKAMVGQDVLNANNPDYLCTMCPSGKYVGETGSVSLTNCINCPVNSLTQGIATSINDCKCNDDLVQRKSSDGTIECIQCDIGKYTNGAICSDCAAGKYQDTKGQSQCTDCPVDTYAETTGNPSAQSCSTCESSKTFTTTNGKSGAQNATSCVCTKGYYLKEGQCLECPEGADCTIAAGLTINTLKTKPDYWRASKDDDTFYLCHTDACIGGSEIENQCSNNTKGVMCSLCADGHARIANICTLCPEGKSNNVGYTNLALTAGFLFFIVMVLYLIRPTAEQLEKKKKVKRIQKSKTQHETHKAVLAKKASNKIKKFMEMKKKDGLTLTKAQTSADVIASEVDDFVEENIENAVSQATTSGGGPSGRRKKGGSSSSGSVTSSSVFVQMYSHIKILIGFLQITSALTMTFDVPWPTSFVNFTNILKSVNIDFQAIVAPLDPCSFNSNYVEAYYYHMITLPSVCFIIVLAGLFCRVLNLCHIGPSFITVQERMSKSMLFIIFIMYPGIGTRVFTMFKCRTVAGISYLEADYNITCWNGEHLLATVSAFVFMIVYILGIPLGSVLVLFRHRKKLWDPNHPEIKRMYGSLFIYYKPHFWWFECVESLKKMALAGGMVIVANGSSLQLLIAIIISLLYLVVILDNHPYDDQKDQKLQMFSTIQTILTLVMGLILKFDDSQTSADKSTVGYVLIFINGSVIIMTILAVVASMPTCAAEAKRARLAVSENKVLESNVKILSGLAPKTINTILKRMTYKTVKPGETVLALGKKQEPVCIIIVLGHVGVYNLNGTYESNLGSGRVVGGDMFSMEHGQTVNQTKSLQALTECKMLTLTAMARDHLIASGHLIFDNVDVEEESMVHNTKVAPVTPETTTNIEKLKDLRTKYGAGSVEYKEAVKTMSKE
jgi:hypothetical protein